MKKARRMEKNIDFNQKQEEVTVKKAPAEGVFPRGFYVTTNLPTYARYNNQWHKVRDQEMDCGIKIEGDKARCITINEVKKGDLIVTGEAGLEVKTVKKENKTEKEFEFMGSAVSAEKSKGQLIKDISLEIKSIKEKGGRIVVVGGPAVIHTGAGKYLAGLIAAGYIDCLFAGNALATHDIESALYGTSLDIPLKDEAAEMSHGYHLKAINKIRKAGSIAEAVKKGILNEGIMYSAVKNNVDYVLAGSIRDDGPLPDVITDTVEAQQKMREKAAGADMVIMLATMLHAIATGNLLSADVKTVCVDINSDTVTKLADRGTGQAKGLVTDVELFLQALYRELV